MKIILRTRFFGKSVPIEMSLESEDQGRTAIRANMRDLTIEEISVVEIGDGGAEHIRCAFRNGADFRR